MANIFGENRAKTDNTQEKTAESAKIAWRTYQRIENNKNLPSMRTFIKLVYTLNISDEDIRKYFDKVYKKILEEECNKDQK